MPVSGADLVSASVVELSSGGWAVVVGPSKRGLQAALVRMVIDADGNEVTGGATINRGVGHEVRTRDIQLGKVRAGGRGA